MSRFFLVLFAWLVVPAMAFDMPALSRSEGRIEGRVWQDDNSWQAIEQGVLDLIEKTQNPEAKAGFTKELLRIRQQRLEDASRQPSPAELREIKKRAAEREAEVAKLKERAAAIEAARQKRRADPAARAAAAEIRAELTADSAELAVKRAIAAISEIRKQRDNIHAQYLRRYSGSFGKAAAID